MIYNESPVFNYALQSYSLSLKMKAIQPVVLSCVGAVCQAIQGVKEGWFCVAVVGAVQYVPAASYYSLQGGSYV